MTGTENTSALEERLARSSRVAAFWSAVGALLVLSALGYSGFRLTRVQKEIQKAETNLRATQAELEAKKTELNNVDAQLTKAKQTAEIYGLTLTTVSRKVPDETATAFKQAVGEVPGATGITIQIAYKSQLGKAKEIAAQLRHLGYELPPDDTIDIRGVHISNDNYVRYFFKSDEALAEQIANQIRAMGIDIQPYSLVGAADLGEVHPRNFELRLGRNYHP